MMIEMGIRPSGDVDTDFVAMMVPHHQGAIEMAQAELRRRSRRRKRRAIAGWPNGQSDMLSRQRRRPQSLPHAK
jgi:uncharacterized protein (DUF305 family)